MFATGIFAGKVFDDFGPRYLLVAGTFLHVFGLMMTSISKTYYQILLSQAVCSGIGASLVFSPAFTSVCSESCLEEVCILLTLIPAGIDMVPPETRCRSRHRRCRLVPRWCCLSNPNH